MNDYYRETIWQYVEYCKYFIRHSTRLDVEPRQTWGNVISFKVKSRYKYPKTYLKHSRRRIQQPGTYSRSSKKEMRIASNDTVRASPLRMWVSYWIWILWVKTTISRKPEQTEQNYSSLLIAKLWARYSQNTQTQFSLCQQLKHQNKSSCYYSSVFVAKQLTLQKATGISNKWQSF